MSDTAHILEEMRSMRGAHTEVLASMTDVSVQVRELVIELRHQQRNNDMTNDRVSKVEHDRIPKIENDIRELQLEAALNKPILDIARAMNTKMLITIITAVGGVGAMNVDWSKFIGG